PLCSTGAAPFKVCAAASTPVTRSNSCTTSVDAAGGNGDRHPGRALSPIPGLHRRTGGLPASGPAVALRHAAVSLWLNAGVPPTEVAQRAGHGSGALLRIYAKCMEGQRAHANKQIPSALKIG